MDEDEFELPEARAAIDRLSGGADPRDLARDLDLSFEEFGLFLADQDPFDWPDVLDAASLMFEASPADVVGLLATTAARQIEEDPLYCIGADEEGLDFAHQVGRQLGTAPASALAGARDALRAFVSSWRRGISLAAAAPTRAIAELERVMVRVGGDGEASASATRGLATVVDARNWRSLRRPAALQRRRSRDGRSETYVAAPLERGFGLTIGTLLRRVALGALPGMAITAVRLPRAANDEVVLEGVEEDALDLIVNLKRVALSGPGWDASPVRMILSGAGPVLRARDIATPRGWTVADPDVVIAHVSGPRPVSIELMVGPGRGYAPAAQARPGDLDVGFEPIDALYSPVRSFSFKVDPARVGGDLDYDQLTLEVESDGTEEPARLLSAAAALASEQLQVFVGFEDPAEPGHVPSPGRPEPAQAGTPAVMLRRVDELDLSARAVNALANDGIVYVGDLVERTEAEMLRIPNLGRRSVNEIVEVLAALGIGLGMSVPGWPPREIAPTDAVAGQVAD